MPRSASPCDSMPVAASTVKFMANGIDEPEGSEGGGSCGGGGGMSSSCSSDEDDGGECSRDSSRSEVHSSPIERGMVSTPPPLNGIEVKPCHVISSVTSGLCRREITDQVSKSSNSCKQFLDYVNQRSSPPLNQDTDSGGRLRFYLDGSCVLELKHDVDDEGRPKQWVQSWGKIYHPPPPSLPPPPQAWQPQELPSQESQDEETVAPLPAITSCSKNKNKKKYLNSQSLTFFLRRRHPSSHYLKKLQFPSCCVLRRVARSPGHIAINKNISCLNGGLLCSCRKRKFRSLSCATSIEKSQNLISIIRKLSQMNEDNKNKEDDVKSNQASSVHPTSALQTSSTPSLSLSSLSSISSSHTMPSSSSPSSPPLQPHVLPESQNRNLECCPVSHLNSEYELKEAESMRKTPEKLENAANRPLPEWYFDPSKASIPVTEMIGYPRPSLFTVQKLALNKRKVSDETPGKLSLDLPVASKKPKDDNKGVLDNDQLSSSLSQDNLLSATAISSLLSVKGSANADKKSSSSMDVVGVKQGNTQSESIGRDPKNDLVQKKRKRGGYGRGRTIGEAVRAFVIGDILNLGGDVRTKYVPRGVFTEVASRYKIDATTTYRWWLKYCNGVRMAASGQQESSQKPFLPSCLTNLSSSDVSAFGVGDPKTFVNDLYRTPDKKNQNPRYMPERHHTTSLLLDKFHSKENGRCSLGGTHSPRSDDSMSSNASMLDASSLSLSSISLGPPNGTWNPSLALPFLANGRLPPTSSSLPLPVGICLPYIWNYPSTPSITNGHNSSYDSHCSDEPLDLTLPKQKDKTVEQGGIGKRPALNKPQDHYCVNDPCTYSECSPSDQLILKTLLSVREQQAASTNFQDIIRHHKTSKLTKGIVSQPTQAQPNLKPKHYPFVSLQIGTFEIHSSFSPNCSDKDYLKENPNKFKVIFTQRKFVYEFETSAKMLMPQTDQQQVCRSRQMACIVVPFSIVEAFWCYGTTIILQVVSKPLMFLGQRLKQVGCVPSLTVYETKKSVDLTGGQLHTAPLHQVILLKPHLVEQLKIYLILFDIRFRNLMAPAVLPVVKHSVESNDDQNS